MTGDLGLFAGTQLSEAEDAAAAISRDCQDKHRDQLAELQLAMGALAEREQAFHAKLYKLKALLRIKEEQEEAARAFIEDSMLRTRVCSRSFLRRQSQN